MRLGKTSPELEKELKSEFLKGTPINPEAAELVGESSVKPEANPTPSGGSGASATTSSETGTVLRRQWTAGQRKTVQSYFKEDK